MVEILLATFNGAKFLKQQLESLQNQTYTKWKLLVCDDGSTDDTLQILNDFKNKSPNEVEIHLNRSKKSRGPSKNFNVLMLKSRARYVAFCDQDDVWLPTKLEHSLNLLRNLEKNFGNLPILVHSDLIIADENLNVIRNSMVRTQKFDYSSNKTIAKLLVQNCVTGCTMVANRALVKLCGFIPKEAIMHDWWLALIACAFGKLEFLDESTIYYRQHGGNMVGVVPIDLTPEEISRKVKVVPKPKSKKKFNLLKRFKFRKLYKLFSVFFWYHFSCNVIGMYRRRKTIRKNLHDTFFQGRAFLRQYRRILTAQQKQILRTYCSLFVGCKIKRVYHLIFSCYLKSGFLRKLAQIFYI